MHAPPARLSPTPLACMANLDRTLLAAGIIALGLTLGGFAVGNGFARARSADRFVTLKGVAAKSMAGFGAS